MSFLSPPPKETSGLWAQLNHLLHLPILVDLYPPAKDGEALYSQQKQDQELTVAQIMNSLLPNSDLNLRK